MEICLIENKIVQNFFDRGRFESIIHVDMYVDKSAGFITTKYVQHVGHHFKLTSEIVK